MKVLLFEDAAEHGSKIIKQLRSKIPDIEILWFGTVKDHAQPPIPNPFTRGASCVLRAKGKVVTKAGTKIRDLDVWPGDLAGAILDIYVNTTKVGEHIARWLEYAQFSGPVLLCSGHDLPPVFPSLPFVFSGMKEANLSQQIDLFCGLLDADTRVNSRGLPPGGAEKVRALRRKQLIWDWLSPDTDAPPFLSVLGPGEPVRTQPYSDRPLLAWKGDVKTLARLRQDSRSSSPFYLVVEREKAGVGPVEALGAGVVYLDQNKLIDEPLRFAAEIAEEFLYRYTALVRRYAGKNLDNIAAKDSPILSAFMIAWIRALAFSGGSRALYRTKDGTGQMRAGWIEDVTGIDCPLTFEKQKKKLLVSAKTLNLVPQALKLP